VHLAVGNIELTDNSFVAYTSTVRIDAGWVGVEPLVISETSFFLNFRFKNAGFYAFLLRKTTCAQKAGPGGLIDPLGARGLKL